MKMFFSGKIYIEGIPLNNCFLRLLLLVAIVFYSEFCYSQGHVSSFSEVSDKEKHASLNTNKKSLKDLILNYESVYKVSIGYEEDLIKDKVVSTDIKVSKSNVEEALGDVLGEFGLKIQKLENNYYIISPREIIEWKTIEKKSFSAGYSDHSEASLNTNASNIYRAGKLPAVITFPEIMIKGKVVDERGEELPGVSVVVKGSNAGTITDVHGNYKINVFRENSTLIFSSMGYSSIESEVAGKTELNIGLRPDVKSLNEVLVIGYGTAKKSDLTGSVGSVRTEQLEERPSISLNQALQGRVPGLAVNANSGRPGGQTNVRIRGFSSIASSNNPLYVVDGVILPIGTQMGNTGAIDFLNPNDIASVEVLKDASATAIYGARGANGVILVTTKKGSKSGGRITYDTQFSIPTIGPKRVELLNAKEFLAVEELAYKNAETYDPEGWKEGKYKDPKLKRSDRSLFDEQGNPLYDTDWLKESTQLKLSQNHQLSVTNGNDNGSYGIFLGYNNQNGLLLNSYLKRFSGRLVFESDIKKWLSAGGSISYNNQDENLVDTGTGGLNSVRMMIESLPILPVKHPDGTWAGNWQYPGMEGGENPVRILQERNCKLLTQTVLGNVYANIRIAKSLEFRSILGGNVISRERNEYSGRNLQGISQDQGGRAILGTIRESYWSSENYLTYSKRISGIHSLTVMGGASWQRTDIFGFTAIAEGFTTDYYQSNNLTAASSYPAPISGRSYFSFNSYFSRINYGLKDKYLITFTGRADGSSKFGDFTKYSFFPSAALAWRISEEPFLTDNIRFISNLKLRSSYGSTGNSEIVSFAALPLLRSNYFAIYNNTKAGGVGIARLGNGNLKWERTNQLDIGFELGLFDNRINLEGDVYYRKTTGMLLSAPLPRSSGYSSIIKNMGSMENRGIEVSLNTTNIITRDFSWTTSFNIAMNRNKVLSLATPADLWSGHPEFVNRTGIIRVGESVGSFYGLIREGTWKESEREEAAKFASYRGGKPILPGDIKYKDINGDYQINDADRVIIGNNNPDAYGSIINTLKYRNFDLTFDLQYSYGNDVLNQTKHSAEDRVGIANSYKSVLNAWTPQNQNTSIAAMRDTRAGYVTNVDSYWVEDGSFLRGRNLLLGYNFPSKFIKKLDLHKVRIYASLQNFFLLTKYSGNDPEVTTYGNAFAQGQTFFDYPKPTIYMLGLNISL